MSEQNETAAAAAPQHAASPAGVPASVDVITQLVVPLGASGRVPPSAAEPNLIPRRASTVEAKQGDRAPSSIATERRPSVATGSAQIQNAAEMPIGTAGTAQARSTTTPAASLLPLAHSLSSAAQLREPGSDVVMSGAAPARPSGAVRPVPLRNEVDQQQMVRRLLQRYVAAFEHLDVEAAKAVWPSVDDKALRRAFDQLEAQHLTFQSCGITIEGSGANARCEGHASYRPRIGSGALRISPREWTFNLARAGSGWQIVDARVR